MISLPQLRSEEDMLIHRLKYAGVSRPLL